MEKLFKNGFRTVSETELVLVDGGGDFNYRPPCGLSYTEGNTEIFCDIGASFDFNERESKSDSLCSFDLGIGRGNIDSITFGIKINY